MKERTIQTLALDGKLKSALHHWWPKCVSESWIDDSSDNSVGRMNLEYEISRIPNHRLGCIRNAHIIRFKENEPSPWDCDLEKLFNDIDSEFPKIVKQLESMMDYSQPKDQMLPTKLDKDMLDSIITGMVSILVRSPRNVEICRRQLEYLADLSESPSIALREQLDRNSRINSLNSLKSIADSMKSGRKIVILYAPRYTEFIFGDGFYHRNTGQSLGERRILMPLTPEISLLCVSGAKYRYSREIGDERIEPDAFTYYLDIKDTVNLNCMLQLYAGKELFFRSSSYSSQDFVCKPFFSNNNLYREYGNYSNDRVNDLVYRIPGIVKTKSDVNAF